MATLTQRIHPLKGISLDEKSHLFENKITSCVYFGFVADDRSGLKNCVDIRSYNYQKLVLLYGPNKNHVVSEKIVNGDVLFLVSLP